MHRISSAVATLALLACLAPSLGAQVTGLPVRNAGVSSGLMIGGEVGFPNADYGKGTAFGGRASVGLGPLGISGLLSSWNPDGIAPRQTGVGGYINFKAFGGPLIPLSATLQGGIEWAESGGVSMLHVPVGLGIALKIPNPTLAIKPWIAPRVDIFRAESSGLPSNTETNFGLSGGVDFSLLGGLGFGAAYDRTWAGSGVNPSVFSLNLSYSIKVPGL